MIDLEPGAGAGSGAPTLTFEAYYGLNDFAVTDPATNIATFERKGEIRWAMALDAKLKIPFLNPRSYFSITPQIYKSITAT